jgi:hypothetical protein
MNKEKQRIAIAEACGWKNADHPDAMKLKQGWIMPEKWCMDPKGVLRFNHHRPDYLTDLNAMHEAEKTLTDEQIARWQRDLWLTCENDFYALEACAPPIVLRRFISATAAQRAEAFLRTIGKWEDDK